MIFQDPFSSLNGRMWVLDIVAEPIRFHKLADSRQEIEQIVRDLIDHVGLDGNALKRYPHEFSGGQRQRISIARALGACPRMPFYPKSSELSKNNARNITHMAVLIFRKFFDLDQNAYSRTGS